MAPVVQPDAGSTAVAGGGLAAAVICEITRNTVSTDCVVKLEETTTVVGIHAGGAAPRRSARAPGCRARCRRASVIVAQVFASAVGLDRGVVGVRIDRRRHSRPAAHW